MPHSDAARAASATGARSAAGRTSTSPAVVPEPPPRDARAVARASLAAGRSPSLWWVCTGVVVVVAVTFTVGANEGALALALLLGVSGAARAVLRPGPVALTVRSRWLDTAVLAGLAVAVGLLARLAPTG